VCVYTNVSEMFPASISKVVQEDIIIIIIIYHPYENHLWFIPETSHVPARVYSVEGILWLQIVVYVIYYYYYYYYYYYSCLLLLSAVHWTSVIFVRLYSDDSEH